MPGHRPRTGACGSCRPGHRRRRTAAASHLGSARPSHEGSAPGRRSRGPGDHERGRVDLGQRLGRVGREICIKRRDVIRGIGGLLIMRRPSSARVLHPVARSPCARRRRPAPRPPWTYQAGWFRRTIGAKEATGGGLSGPPWASTATRWEIACLAIRILIGHVPSLDHWKTGSASWPRFERRVGRFVGGCRPFAAPGSCTKGQRPGGGDPPGR
jgi:hypothetical protein